MLVIDSSRERTQAFFKKTSRGKFMPRVEEVTIQLENRPNTLGKICKLLQWIALK
jgi:hypothetical protein